MSVESTGDARLRIQALGADRAVRCRSIYDTRTDRELLGRHTCDVTWMGWRGCTRRHADWPL